MRILLVVMKFFSFGPGYPEKTHSPVSYLPQRRRERWLKPFSVLSPHLCVFAPLRDFGLMDFFRVPRTCISGALHETRNHGKAPENLMAQVSHPESLAKAEPRDRGASRQAAGPGFRSRCLRASASLRGIPSESVSHTLGCET